MEKLYDEVERAGYLIKNREKISRETFCQVFRGTVEMYPDRIAVYEEGKTVTYRQLLRLSEAVAVRLIRDGIKCEEIVAICTDRTIKTVAGMIGIWMAGGAFVYLENSYPEDRKRHILKECDCRFLLDIGWWENLNTESELQEKDRAKRDCLALIIYTSGSTANPKGVMLEHKNVVAAMYNFQIFGIHKEEHVGVFAGFGFVAAISDLFATLAVGAAAYLIPGPIRKDIRALAVYYREHQIRVTFLPPHMVRKLLNMDLENFPLRLLLVGSEPVRNLSLAPFQMFNVYGASEMSALIAHYEIHDSRNEIYPVGKLNPGLRGYLVSDNGKPVEKGEEGELWLAGPQVSRGYYKLPEMTATQYIKNPFSQDPGFEKVFKTNDILREMEDGNLQYICRKDNVYKIRGFRVESTAVEHAILECAPVIEVVAKAFMDDGGVNILCGYFTARQKLDVKMIKERLKEKLPYYMVPTCLIQLDDFPRNTNAKIDKKAISPPKELNDHKLLEKLY